MSVIKLGIERNREEKGRERDTTKRQLPHHQSKVFAGDLNFRPKANEPTPQMSAWFPGRDRPSNVDREDAINADAIIAS